MIRLLGILAAVGLLTATAAWTEQQEMLEYVIVGSGGGGMSGQVTTYRLDRTTGDLTQIDRQDVGGLASYIAAHPRYPVLYVTAERGGAMHWVRIDPATGMLTPAGRRAGAGNPVYASVDATGRVVLGVNHGQGTTDVFPLDPSTGAITGAPVTHETGPNTHAAAFHPDNTFVYAPVVRDSVIAQYAYADGALRPLDPARVAVPGNYRHIVVHPSGDFAYAISGATDSVGTFSIGPDGALTLLGAVRRLPQAQAAEAAVHMGSNIEVTPSGRFAYAANRGQSNTLAIYSIGADGSLTLVGHESTRGRTPRELAIDPDGEFVIVGNQDSQTVTVFRADAETGALRHLNTEEIGVNPWFVGVFRFPAT